jgi:uncharacterized membrane protein
MGNKLINDKDIQRYLGLLLRGGVLLSMAVVLIGGIVYLNDHQDVVVNYKDFSPSFTPFTQISTIIKGLLSFKGDAIVQFGILLLIFTPIARILFAIISFLFEKDYLYVCIGLIILAIISISLSGGLAH